MEHIAERIVHNKAFKTLRAAMPIHTQDGLTPLLPQGDNSHVREPTISSNSRDWLLSSQLCIQGHCRHTPWPRASQWQYAPGS